MRKLFTTIFVMLFSLIIFADINLSVEMTQPQITRGRFTKDLPLRDEVGAPLVPFYPVRVLLPQGEEVTEVEVKLSEEKNLRSNFVLEHTQQQQPISKPTADLTKRDEVIYSTNRAFPYEDYRFLGVQKLNGYSFAIINIYPYKYNPVTQRLDYYEIAEIEIKTKTSLEEPTIQITDFALVAEKLKHNFLNSEANTTYRELSYSSNRYINLSTPHDMVVITNSELVPTFEEYLVWRNSESFSAMLVTTEEIYASYEGVDNPAKIKNFIRDAYNSWANTATPLEYVLLGGDDEIIPIRGVYGNVYGTIDHRMPSDLYYGCLDGSWDPNGNGIYTEDHENVDLVPEVSVGRIPAETAPEFNRVFHKIKSYVDTHNYGDNTATMFGESLNNDPVTWGGDYKDEIVERMPNNYLITTQYQRDGTWSSAQSVVAVNENATIMNHMGHANENTVNGFSSSTINSMTNTQYGFLYTQGCYPAAFDNATSGGMAGNGECVAEYLMIGEHGLHSFVGNTRYGWYSPGSTNGASQYFDRSFFDGMFIDNIREIGKAHNYSLLDNLNSALESSVMKWCYLELVVFGDPSIAVKEFNHDLAYINVDNINYLDVIGDGDGNVNPGETIELEIEFSSNSNWSSSNKITATLVEIDERIEIINSATSTGPLPSGGTTITSAERISFVVPESIPFSTINYKLIVESYDNSNVVNFSKEYTFSFDITLLGNNFPQEFSIGTKSSPVFVDYNNNGENEIVYLDTFGNLRLINLQGETVLEQPSEVQENIYSSYAVTEIEGTPVIVYTSRTNNIVAQEIGGDVLFRVDTGAQIITSPIIADINGDGNYEIIAANIDKELLAYDFNGVSLANFPVTLNAFTVYEMAVADLDGDGKKDIVIATNNNEVQAINYLGESLPNYPVILPAVNAVAPLITSDRVVVGTAGHLYSLDYAGNIVHDFEVLGSPISPTANDFNNDNYIDYGFATTTRHLYIVSENGEILEGFPQRLARSCQTPTLSADVNGDGYPEIIAMDSSNNIYMYNYQGEALPNFPFNSGLATANPATMGNVNNNGEFSIVMGYSQGIACANLKQPINLEVPAWLSYRNGYHRTGFFDSSFAVSNEDNNIEVVATSLNGNYPNPFNPETTIAFSLAKSSRVKLDIYNIRGQKVKTLVNERMDSGKHTAVWNGTDKNNRKVSSGVYLYRLTTDTHKFNNKMILMK